MEVAAERKIPAQASPKTHEKSWRHFETGLNIRTSTFRPSLPGSEGSAVFVGPNRAMWQYNA